MKSKLHQAWTLPASSSLGLPPASAPAHPVPALVLLPGGCTACSSPHSGLSTTSLLREALSAPHLMPPLPTQPVSTTSLSFIFSLHIHSTYYCLKCSFVHVSTCPSSVSPAPQGLLWSPSLHKVAMTTRTKTAWAQQYGFPLSKADLASAIADCSAYR